MNAKKNSVCPRRGAWLALALLLAAPVAALSQQAPAPAPPEPAKVAPPRGKFEVIKAASPIKVDGILDEEAWKGATVIDMPYEWYPSDNGTPPVQTQALVTYDHDQLYIGFRCQDPDPKAIRGRLMDRDAVTAFVQDDHVGVTLDTFNDERRAFQFRINPAGVQVDATFSEANGGEDFSWDAIWASAGAITPEGWVVEVAIPFRQLRFPRSSEPQTWGIEVFRSYPRSVRHRISSRWTDRAKDCTLCEEGKISGFEGIAPGRNVSLYPTVTGLRSDVLDSFPNGELVKDKNDVEPGLTVRWGITPSVTLDAAINPDFSQVDALFFPEKRPFFLEGADLFITPIQAVFTRTVAEPDFGLKLSSKEGKNAFGMFVARDDLNNLVIPSNQGSNFAFLTDDVDSGVVRYRRDVGGRSAIGLMYTDRESANGPDYHNRVAALDGFFGLTTSDTLRVQYLRSDTLYPDDVVEALGQPRGSFDDDAFRVQYDHFARAWRGYVFYEDLGDEFRADSGFVPRVDTKTAEGRYERLYYGGRDKWFAQASWGGRFTNIKDHEGTLTDRTYEVFGTYAGPRQTAFDAHLYRNTIFFDGETFDLNQQLANFSIIPRGWLRLGLSGQFGDDIDFDNTRKATSTTWLPSVQLRFQHLNVTASWQDQKLRVAGGELFDAQLTQARIVYQFDVRTFVRAIIQYRDTQRNQDLYLFPVRAKDRNLFGQFLFSYKINPQTVLFAGYTQNEVGRFRIPLTETDRSFFIKIGYALLY